MSTGATDIQGIDVQAWRSKIRADVFGRYHLDMAAAIMRLENDAPAAIAHLRRAVAIEPELTEAHALLIDLLAATGDEPGAAAAQAAADAAGVDCRGVGRCWRVLRALNEAGPAQAQALMARLGPPDAEPIRRRWAALGVVVDTATGRHDAGRVAVPDGPPPSPAVAALDQAIADAFAALTAAPGHGLPPEVALQTTAHAAAFGTSLPAPHVQRVHMLNAQGRTDEALAAVERGLADFPRHAPLWEMKGAVLMNVEARLGEAPAALEEALRLNPSLPSARSALRRVLAIVGRLSDAVEAVRAALAETPDEPALINECGMFLHARRFAGDEDAALERYAEMTRRAPRSPNPLWMSAMIHARRGDVGRARELTERAMKMAPDAPHPLSARGLVAVLEGNADQAVSLCREGLERAKPPAQNHIQRLALGAALEAAGRTAEAEAAFREAVAGAPGAVWLAHRLLGPFQEPLEKAMTRIGFTRTGYWPAAIS